MAQEDNGVCLGRSVTEEDRKQGASNIENAKARSNARRRD